MERKTVVIGNWKMHKTSTEAVDFIHQLTPLVAASKSQVFLAVPFTSVSAAVAAAQNTNIVIGVQNIHTELQGPYTGEISSVMLREEGVDFTLIGHSERRKIFFESDEFIHKKILRALQDDLIAVLCVGETAKQRDQNLTESVLSHQVTTGTKNVPVQDLDRLIIAYEPVWAIGTGKVATPEIAEQAGKQIRKQIATLFGKSDANKISILYGGSVKPDNFPAIMEQENIDGALVGNASLDPHAFSQIVNVG